MFDLLIKNANVYDGSGKDAERLSVAVIDGKIAAIAPEISGEAKEVIDANGLALTPGFIDAHTHSDRQIFNAEPTRESKLLQGVTTEVGGNCGSSLAPFVNEAGLDDATISGIMGNTLFPSYAAYAEEMNKTHFGCNQIALVGQKQIRASVMGVSTREANDKERGRMKELMEECMQTGAIGMSTGLVYAPSCYSSEEEIVDLLKVVAKYDGIYSTHVRGEGDTVVESIEEAIRIAKKAGVALNISHLKAMFPQNYHKVDQILEIIDREKAAGLDISFDVYPYVATSSNTTSALPHHYLSMGAPKLIEFLGSKEGVEKLRHDVETGEGMLENPLKFIGGEGFLFTKAAETPEIVGKRLSELAAERGKDIIETLCEIFHDNHLAIGDCRFTMSEDNLVKEFAHPLCMVGTDALYYGGPKTVHPRAFGTFPRYLGRYIREKKALPLKEAVHRLTGMPAKRYGIANKGLIKVGYDADITIFNPDTIIDGATFENPALPNVGIEYVISGGMVAVKNNTLVAVPYGKLILKK